SEGCIISGGHADRSVLSPKVRVNSFSEVLESILFENVEIGRHCKIRRAIIDKNVDIPPGMTIGYDPEEDRQRFQVTESGVVVIPKGMKVPQTGPRADSGPRLLRHAPAAASASSRRTIQRTLKLGHRRSKSERANLAQSRSAIPRSPVG